MLLSHVLKFNLCVQFMLYVVQPHINGINFACCSRRFGPRTWYFNSERCSGSFGCFLFITSSRPASPSPTSSRPYVPTSPRPRVPESHVPASPRPTSPCPRVPRPGVPESSRPKSHVPVPRPRPTSPSHVPVPLLVTAFKMASFYVTYIGPFHFFIPPPPPRIEGPGFLRGRGGRFCRGNCVGTFNLCLNIINFVQNFKEGRHMRSSLSYGKRLKDKTTKS